MLRMVLTIVTEASKPKALPLKVEMIRLPAVDMVTPA